MKTKRILLTAVLACAAGLATVDSARADHGCGFGCASSFYFSNGFGYGGGAYGLGNIPLPPYFSLHPPVYYGERYYRPYGVSPFAADSQLQVNERYRPAPRADFLPLTVPNPYCDVHVGAAATADGDGRVAARHEAPLLIENPFCKRLADSESKAPVARLAKHAE